MARAGKMGAGAGVDVSGEVEELRAVVREAHEALKDLRAAIREARGVGKEAVNSARGVVEAEVRERVAELGVATSEAMEQSVKKVGKEFDKLANVFLGRDGNEKSLEELVQEMRVWRDGGGGSR